MAFLTVLRLGLSTLNRIVTLTRIVGGWGQARSVNCAMSKMEMLHQGLDVQVAADGHVGVSCLRSAHCISNRFGHFRHARYACAAGSLLGPDPPIGRSSRSHYLAKILAESGRFYAWRLSVTDPDLVSGLRCSWRPTCGGWKWQIVSRSSDVAAAASMIHPFAVEWNLNQLSRAADLHAAHILSFSACRCRLNGRHVPGSVCNQLFRFAAGRDSAGALEPQPCGRMMVRWDFMSCRHIDRPGPRPANRPRRPAQHERQAMSTPLARLKPGWPKRRRL